MTLSPLSVQICSVPDSVAADLTGTLARLATIGYTQVELYGFVDRAEEFGRALTQNGLVAPSGHAPLLQYTDPRFAFEAAASLGIKTMIDPLVPADQWQTVDKARVNAERMNAMADIAAEFDLVFGYHNHWWEIESRHEGRTLLEVFADELAPNVVLEIDTFWAQVGGVDAPELLARLGDKVQLLHVKDGAIARDPLTQQPVGHGEMDIPAVLRSAPQALRVVEFDGYAGDLFTALDQSYRYLTDLEGPAAS